MMEKWKGYTHDVDENGFSLLELVVAVGILLVLTVGGLLSYNGILKSARQAAVEAAASEVVTAAMAHELDFDAGSVAKDAETEWNATSKKDANGNAQIAVEVIGNQVCLAAKATHVKGEEAVKSSGEGCPDDISAGDYFGPDATPLPGGSDNGNNPGNGGNSGNTNPGENGTPGNGGSTNPENDGFSSVDSGTEVVDNPTEESSEVQVSAENSATSSLYGVLLTHRTSAGSAMENGGSIEYKYEDFNEHMAVGTDIYVSEWLTNVEGFTVSSSLDYRGSSNGFARYTANSSRATNDTWLSVNGELNMSSGTPGNTITTRTVLPSRVKWVDFEDVSGKFYTSGGRAVWDFTTDHNYASGENGSEEWEGSGPGIRLSSNNWDDEEYDVQLEVTTNQELYPVGTVFEFSSWIFEPGDLSSLWGSSYAYNDEIALQDAGNGMTRIVLDSKGDSNISYYFGQAYSAQPSHSDLRVRVVLPEGHTFENGRSTFDKTYPVKWNGEVVSERY